MGRGYKIAPTLLSEKSGKQNDRYSEKLDAAGGIIHKDDILGFALQESQIIKNNCRFQHWPRCVEFIFRFSEVQ